MQCKFQTVLGALPQGISPRCAFFTCFAMAMEETNGIHTMVVSEVLDTRATYGDGRYNSTMGNFATNVKTILSINPFLYAAHHNTLVYTVLLPACLYACMAHAACHNTWATV